MKSVLHKASSSDVIDAPFPHIVLYPALDVDLYQELAACFPSADILISGRSRSNNKYHYRACDIIDNRRISPVWREFAAYHVSQVFYEEVAALFGEHIRLLHPALERNLGKRIEDLRSSIRFKEECKDVALECQFAFSPGLDSVWTPQAPHVDREVSLYAGLLYFRLEEDDSTGGNLELYRFKGNRAEYGLNRTVPQESVERVETVEYRKNSAIFFPNSRNSLHGVSTRAATRFPRRHINFVGELQSKVFELPGYRE